MIKFFIVCVIRKLVTELTVLQAFLQHSGLCTLSLSLFPNPSKMAYGSTHNHLPRHETSELGTSPAQPRAGSRYISPLFRPLWVLVMAVSPYATHVHVHVSHLLYALVTFARAYALHGSRSGSITAIQLCTHISVYPLLLHHHHTHVLQATT